MPRYIDVNLVKESLLGWDEDPSDEDLEYAIDNIPTADVEEVKHGYVIEHQGAEDEYYCECSVCKTHEVSLGDKYCSECGAKMDGGKTELPLLYASIDEIIDS